MAIFNIPSAGTGAWRLFAYQSTTHSVEAFFKKIADETGCSGPLPAKFFVRKLVLSKFNEHLIRVFLQGGIAEEVTFGEVLVLRIKSLRRSSVSGPNPNPANGQGQRGGRAF